MQIATNLDYPLNIGGRPLIAWQAFALIGFELTVLFSVLFMVVGFFVLNRLPRYHYPLFDIDRSEEHTSELQSLMRISYAVFCLKKKKIQHTEASNHITQQIDI